MKKLKFALASLLFIGLCSAVSAQPTMMKHQAKGVSCEQCHNYPDLAKASAEKKVALNPHDSHAGQLRCTLCHKEHQQSVVYCRQCHKNADDKRFDMTVP